MKMSEPMRSHECNLNVFYSVGHLSHHTKSPSISIFTHNGLVVLALIKPGDDSNLLCIILVGCSCDLSCSLVGHRLLVTIPPVCCRTVSTQQHAHNILT